MNNSAPLISEKPHPFAGWVLLWEASGRAFIGKVNKELTIVGRVHLEPVYEYGHAYGTEPRTGKIGMRRDVFPVDLSTSLRKLVIVPTRLTELDELDPDETAVLKADVDAAEKTRAAMRDLRRDQAKELLNAPSLIIPPGAH